MKAVAPKIILLLIVLKMTLVHGFNSNTKSFENAIGDTLNQYHKWFEIKLSHDYFISENLPIQFVPTQKTSQTLRDHNIVVRTKNTGLVFYYQSNTEVNDDILFLKNMGILEFNLINTDRLLFNYTDFETTEVGNYFIFKNIADNQEIKLEKVASRPFEAGTNAFGLLKINTQDLNTEELKLSFKSRKTIWEYEIKLWSDQSVNSLKINKANTNVQFNIYDKKTLENGSYAYVFRSTEPMALKEKGPNESIKLTGNLIDDSGEVKKMNIQLPFPGIHILSIEGNSYISTVYIYL